jgi:hypothetical protein
MMFGGPSMHGTGPAARWRATGLVAVATAMLALVSCGGGKGDKNDKNADLPAITLSSGNQKVSSIPVSYLQNGTLRQASPTLLSLPVRPGATVTITTPQEVADRGWQLSLDDKVVVARRTVPTGTVTVPTNLTGRQPLVTILAAPVGESNRASGLWLFRLSPS